VHRHQVRLVQRRSSGSRPGSAGGRQRKAAWRRDGIRPPVAVWTLRQLIIFLAGVENDRLAAGAVLIGKLGSGMTSSTATERIVLRA
jgi:hypothetical protein